MYLGGFFADPLFGHHLLGILLASGTNQHTDSDIVVDGSFMNPSAYQDPSSRALEHGTVSLSMWRH